MKTKIKITKILFWIVSVWVGCANATTGLTGLEGIGWILLFLQFLALTLVVIVVIYLFKYRHGAKPSNVFRVVTIVLLLLGSPVPIVAFGVAGFNTFWFTALLLYLSVLTIAFLIYFKNSKLILGCVSIILLAYIINAAGVISFTVYHIVDNEVFKPTHELAELHGTIFIRTADNQLYRSKSRIDRKLLKIGAKLEIVQRSPSNLEKPVFSINRIGKSNLYYYYLRNHVDPWLTIPIRSVSIQRNSIKRVDDFELLTNSDWKATHRDLFNSLANEDCCNTNWIIELIDHGADPTNIDIGGRNILHILAGEISRKAGIVKTTKVLIQAGVKINQVSGGTPLQIAVTSANHRKFQKPEIAARFIAFISLLLESGADPNIQSKGHLMPLHKAVILKRYELANLLLEYGADPRIERTTKYKAFNNSALKRANSDLRKSTDENESRILRRLIEKMQRVKPLNP